MYQQSCRYTNINLIYSKINCPNPARAAERPARDDVLSTFYTKITGATSKNYHYQPLIQIQGNR